MAPKILLTDNPLSAMDIARELAPDEDQGAAFLAYLDQAGLANTGAWLNGHLGTKFEVQKYEFGIYGVILLVVMLFRPQGLFGRVGA